MTIITLLRKAFVTKHAKTTCNYSDNYYGDQVCSEENY